MELTVNTILWLVSSHYNPIFYTSCTLKCSLCKEFVKEYLEVKYKFIPVRNRVPQHRTLGTTILNKGGGWRARGCMVTRTLTSELHGGEWSGSPSGPAVPVAIG
jgi:hypothetical protein